MRVGAYDPKNLPEDIYNLYLQIAVIPCVDFVIVSDGKVLLARRNIPPNKGMWHLPGGRAIKGERLVDTVTRKAREETGLEVEIVKYLGYFDYPESDPRGHFLSHAYLLKPVGGELRNNEENSELKFFDMAPKEIGFLHHKQILKATGFYD